MKLISFLLLFMSFSFQVYADFDVCTQIEMRRNRLGNSPFSHRIQRETTVPRHAPDIVRLNLKKDIEVLTENLKKYLYHRTQFIETFLNLKERVNNNQPLKAFEINQIYIQAKTRLEIRDEIFKNLSKYRCEVYRYSLDAFKKSNRGWAFRLNAYALASRLIMNDNYALSTILIESVPELRRLINDGNSTYRLDKDSIEDETDMFYSMLNMEDKYRMIDIYRFGKSKYQRYVKRNPNRRKDTHLESMMKIIETSFTYKNFNSRTFGAELKQDLIFFSKKLFTGQHTTVDFFTKLVYDTVYYAIAAFSYTIAQIQWKKGVLYNNTSVHDRLMAQMQPGDVLWDRTRNKVSGVLIPGFWNHNAIYIGTENQLKELGIWNHPTVKRYHRKIKKGKLIAEALSYGVVMNTMKHFLNVDDIAVGRKKNITREERINSILLTLSNVGKSYDFVFNTNSESEIICSELVMIAHPDVEFEHNRLMGNWSTTPDLLSKETFDGGTFEIYSLYYNGVKLVGDYEKLMKIIFEKKELSAEVIEQHVVHETTALNAN